jgi:hypothetical protein
MPTSCAKLEKQGVALKAGAAGTFIERLDRALRPSSTEMLLDLAPGQFRGRAGL